ncbi:cytochrome protein [Rhypophila decipiens]|uniref:Cytochrome protein n=1 Tax=Rhypophila decipiens TaxID=261697 RepID=A0AAN6Y648_9PEZI|nr:cytochrome protein [Rhypophila decipiens]
MEYRINVPRLHGFIQLYEDSSAGQLASYGAGLLLFLTTTYTVGVAIYNLYFHPLASFPGPFLARSSLIWRIIHSIRGRIHLAIDDGHKKYGPVFRVSPNELSFASLKSWKDIYGHAVGNKQTLVKSEFYDMYGSGFKKLCIGSERDPQKHRKMKQSLSAAFATKALREQEAIVANVVDAFINKIGRLGGPGSDKGLNMTKWYEMLAFDILGEMAFGEPFGCIEDGKPHFWQELILDHLFFITVADNLRRFPLVPTIARLVFPYISAVSKTHTNYTRAKVERRLATKSGRKDLMSNLLSKVESGEIDKEEMTAHASTLVIAGGETVATFLAAATFYLLKDRAVWDTLCREVRGRFTNYQEINAAAAQQLPYLQAVINEGLRIYPPGSQGFPRVSPGTDIDGHWVPKGTEVYTSAYTVTHDEQYFPDPYKFDPERWLDPESKSVKEASQPFSLGPRGCLGQNFAIMEVNQILAKMIFRYDWEAVDDSLNWQAESRCHVMWWKPGLYVRFRERLDVGGAHTGAEALRP